MNSRTNRLLIESRQAKDYTKKDLLSLVRSLADELETVDLELEKANEQAKEI